MAARYTSNSGQTISNNSGTTVVFEDIDYDTHGKMDISTGEYEIHSSGKYSINSKITFDAVSRITGNYLLMYIAVNGTIVSTIAYNRLVTSHTQPITLTGADLLDLSKGDVVKIIALQNNGTRTLVTDDKLNSFSIARIK